jgi:hypothetical protein
MSYDFDSAGVSAEYFAEVPLDEQPDSPACSTKDACSYGGFKCIRGEDWSVSMRQTRKGFRCNAVIDAILPVSPDRAFDLLTDPEVKQWRQVKVIYI